MDDLERRSRLVSLAYPVLAAMALPMDSAADGDVYSALASAFHKKAAEAAQLSQRERHQTRLAASGAPTRFTAVANNDLGVYYVFDLYSEKSAIAVIKEDGRSISYIIYEANDINAAVRNAENIYPNYHHVKDILALS